MTLFYQARKDPVVAKLLKPAAELIALLNADYANIAYGRISLWWHRLAR
jgi:hypothetical protein